MADNTSVSSGATIAVATDEATYSGDASKHVQLIRQVGVAGAEGSKTVYDITFQEDAAANSGDGGIPSLYVRNDANATRTSADGDYGNASVDLAGNVNVIGRCGTADITVASGGLTTASTAYTAGDQVGTQFTLTGAARASGGSGKITGIVLADVNDIIGAYDVVIFRSTITPASDNAAFSISDADSKEIVAIIQLAGAFDIGGNRIAQALNLAISYVCSGSANLYAALICRVGHTFFAAVTDLNLRVYVEKD